MDIHFRPKNENERHIISFFHSFSYISYIQSPSQPYITHTQSVITAIFPGEPGIAGCPLIILLHLFLNCASFLDIPKLSTCVILNTIPPGLFRASSRSKFFNFPRYTTFDSVIIIFSFNMSKPSQPTPFDHQTDWFQS